MKEEKWARPWTYRLLVISVPLFMLLYVAAALVPGKERYLLYAWFVFPRVPANAETTYEAYVLSAHGIRVYERLESSTYVLRDEARNTPEYRRRVRAIGLFLTEGRIEESERERSGLESLVRARPLTYEIQEVIYSPIEKFLHGNIIATTSIGVYTVR